MYLRGLTKKNRMETNTTNIFSETELKAIAFISAHYSNRKKENKHSIVYALRAVKFDSYMYWDETHNREECIVEFNRLLNTREGFNKISGFAYLKTLLIQSGITL